MLLCLAMMFVGAAPASAAIVNVNTTADTQVAGGCDTVTQCSLRDAIDFASTADGNTVMIPEGRYELNLPDALGDLDVDADMTITGAGARSTVIDANRLSRVLFVADADHVVSISGVTLTGGLSQPTLSTDTFRGDGGAIFTFGAVSLTDVTLTGNEAAFGGGGIFSEPVEDIFGPEVAQPLELVRTTVSNNTIQNSVPSEGQGGGIAAFGELTLTNSTVHGNSVLSDGLNFGGGIVSSNGLTRIVNSTITGNSLVNPTGLGGGISLQGVDTLFDAELEAINTIVAGNTVDAAESDCSPGADVNLTDNNISGDDTCGFTDPGSQEDTDPLLFALRNNGGPTDTRNFPLTSPALDKGTGTDCPGTDQRGQPRPHLTACDVGAVELAPPGAVTGGVDGLTDAAATLLGTSTNPLIQAGTASFEYGTTTAYGASVPSGGTVSLHLAGTPGVPTNTSEAEDAALIGLTANTTYHYRLVVQNADGIARGADRTFTTPASANLPGSARSRPRVSVAGVSRSCVRRAFTLRVRARVASGTRLKAVRVTLDGRTLKRSKKGSFTVRVNAARLRSGRHTLRIKAVDRGNRTRTVTRRFTRCARVASGQPRFTG